MSIEVGKIKITKEINDNFAFFKFKQNKIEYYAISFLFDDQREGYLAFTLNDKYNKLFQRSDYNNQIMIELIKKEVENLYFISFADEDPESELVEYVGKIDKEVAINIYESTK